MNLGISTSTLRAEGKNLLDYIETLIDSGFLTIEADTNDNATFPYQNPDFIRHLAGVVDAVNMKIHSVHAPFHYDVSCPSDDQRGRAVYEIKEMMECLMPLIVEMKNKPYLVIHPGYHLTETSDYEQMQACIKSLEELLNYPLSDRFQICIENMLSSHFGAKSAELNEMVEHFGPGKVNICLDTSHAVYDSNPERMLDEMYPYVATAHLSDNYHQHHGEFHAIPMSLVHSKIDWRHFIRHLYTRMDTAILELHRPYLMDVDLYLKMARLSALQLQRYLE